jgi:hypothetical protein
MIYFRTAVPIIYFGWNIRVTNGKQLSPAVHKISAELFNGEREKGTKKEREKERKGERKKETEKTSRK